MPNTSRPVAPTAFKAAITSSLWSIWLLTALATPTPPTSSAARPTSVKNCVKRLILRSSCGEALERLRTSQPACGAALRASAMKVSVSRSLLAISGSFTR
ncbi:hypothetical protein ACVWWR_003360 [Bradyrhizobium sp. LM3.2]